MREARRVTAARDPQRGKQHHAARSAACASAARAAAGERMAARISRGAASAEDAAMVRNVANAAESRSCGDRTVVETQHGRAARVIRYAPRG